MKRYVILEAVSNGTKILKWKQVTTNYICNVLLKCCFQWNKDTKMKASHNDNIWFSIWLFAVSNGTKILKWKQVTTIVGQIFSSRSCFQWNKDTKMKASHNHTFDIYSFLVAVSNGTKILKWKQVTTPNTEGLNTDLLFPMEQRY